jgi:hypothetical protein
MEADVALAVGALLWLSTVACSRADAPLPMPGTLRAHLSEERFETVTSLGGLSLGVSDALRQLFGTSSLDIADPGAQYQGSAGDHREKLPTRRLVAAGCSSDHCRVYYERAGSDLRWRPVPLGPDATRFEWGGAAPGGLLAIHDVRHAILSGKITSPDRSW